MGTLYRLASHTKQPLPDTPLTMNAFITLFACVAAASAQTVLNYGGPGAYVAQPYQGVPAAYAAAAPAYAPVAAPVAAAPYHPSSQFQAQDEFGNIQYGYSNLNSVKQEVGNTYGGVSGSYSYVDANGQVQTTNYVADHLGFRVQATNLPVAPAAPEVELPVAPVHEYELPEAPVHEYELPVAPTFNPEPLVAPVFEPAPLEDTPEVKAAKAAFQEAFDAEANREKRSAETPAATTPLVVPAAPAVVAAPAYAALVHPGAAVVASAPAVRDAELHTVKLNPGHA